MSMYGEYPDLVATDIVLAEGKGYRLADVNVFDYKELKSKSYVMTYVRKMGDPFPLVRIAAFQYWQEDNKTLEYGSIELYEKDLQRAAHVCGYEKILQGIGKQDTEGEA